MTGGWMIEPRPAKAAHSMPSENYLCPVTPPACGISVGRAVEKCQHIECRACIGAKA